MKTFLINVSKKQIFALIGICIAIVSILIFWMFSGNETHPEISKNMNKHKTHMQEMKEDIIQLSPRARKLAQVEVAPVVREFLRFEIRLFGKVDYDETRVSHITAWVPGRIEKLFVNFTGMEVKAGDPMAEYYSPELIVAQEELLQFLQSYRELENTQMSFTKNQSKGNLESARTKLRLLGIDDQQIQKIEDSGEVQEVLTVYAPDSGIVIHKNSLEGEYVKEGTKIYTIANLEELWIQIEAYESDLMWIKLDQNVSFTTEAYPGKEFQGTISFIDPFLNEMTRTASVRVNVDNREGQLKPGMYVTAKIRSFITADEKVYAEKPIDKQAPLIIPVTAPLITGKRAVVYIQKQDKEGEYQLREVILGPRSADYYIVSQGINEGDLVVVNGNFKIDSAAQIQAKPSMMSPEGGKKMMKGHGGH